MKKITLLLLLLFSYVFTFSQNKYDARGAVNNEPAELQQQSLVNAAAKSGFNKSGELVLDEGFDDISLLEDDGWFMKNMSEPEGSTGWFQGNTSVFTSWDGDSDAYIAANFNNTSGVGTISNWLVTPEVLLKNGATFSFRTRVSDSSWEDRLEVRLSKEGGSLDIGEDEFSTGDFQELIIEINPEHDSSYPTSWTLYTFTIEGLEEETYGRFAFRYFLTEAGPSTSRGDYIGIDRVRYQLPQTYTVALFASPTAGGNVGGAGQYVESESASITAVPNEGYMFTHWSNNLGSWAGSVSSTQAQFDYTVLPVDINLTAHFTDKIPAMELSRNAFQEQLDEGYTVTRSLWIENTGDADSKLDVRMHLQAPWGNSEPISIMFLHTMTANDVDIISDTLLLLDMVDNIEVVNVTSQTPDLDAMREYDIIMVSTDTGIDDSTLLSSNLQSYVDEGGRLILMLGAILQGGGWALTEDIMSEEYSPLAATSSFTLSKATSTNFYPHPITESVGSISSGVFGASSLQGDGISLGNFSVGHPIGAYNPNKPVIALNIFARDGYWEGDLPVLLENSFKWLMNDISWVQLDKFTSEIADNEEEQFRLTFNAVDMDDGLYEAELFVYTNDPEQNMTTLPVSLRIGAGIFSLELEASPQEGGAVSGSGDYEEGQTVNISATPQEGYEFINWTGDIAHIDDAESAATLVTMPSADMNLTANFALADYELTVSIAPEESGTVNIDPEQGFYNMGDEITLTATPEEGYVFINWSGDIAHIDDAESATAIVNMPAGDVELTANFAYAEYELTINLSPEESGTVNIDPEQGFYNMGDEITLTATPEEGYVFINWTGDIAHIDDAESATAIVNMPAGDVELTANFAFAEYELTINLTPEGAGSVSVEPEQDFFHLGDVVTLTATAHEGYRFVSWLNEADTISSDAQHNFTVSENVTLTALFETTTDVLQFSQNSIGLYPNPSNGIFTLQNAQGFTLEVFNIAGQRVWYKQDVTQRQQTLDVSALEAGIYFLRLSDARGSETLRLIIE